MFAPVILASASPRRAQLLQQLDLKFTVHAVNIDESVKPDENPKDYVVRVAREKAIAGARVFGDDVIILAADTTVSVKGHVLGKPDSIDSALAMWHSLSGRWHDVHTGIALAYKGDMRTICQSSEVLFKSLSDDMMQAYWKTGEPQDKAGGYAIQGRAASWIKKIKGSYSGIMGLPLYETSELLKEAGVNLKL